MSVRDDETSLQRLGTKVVRHWRWARTEGLARLIEEDQLDPFDRLSSAARRWWWRRSQEVAPGTARPVFLVGLQRSGTNMLVRGFEASPEFEVHNENDRAAFDRFRLRSDAVVRSIVTSSRHRYVLFKPLCDSHRVDELLDNLATPNPGRAIWAYRSVDGRVRSALAKFGDANLRVLRDIAAGEADGRWQAQRLSEESLDLIRSFDYDTMTPASAAALFWYVRNSLYFELGLHERADVLLSSYDALIDDPEAGTRRLCQFLDFPWNPRLMAHISARSNGHHERLELDPFVRGQCDELQKRLDATLEERSYSPGGLEGE